MKSKVKRAAKAILITAAILPATLLLLFAVLFAGELRSLASVRRLNEKDMYAMTIYCDYGFDEFLEQGGAKSDEELEAHVKKTLLKGLPISLDGGSYACSSFVTQNEDGEVLFGRNFDFRYAPSVILYTAPKGGYKSVGVADMAFAGYTRESIPKKDGISAESLMMLSMPYLTEDGMNEKGVSISIMTVPTGDAPEVDGAPWLTSTCIVRMVLDNASTVDEAVELMRNCNPYWWEGIRNHFLIADASGRSVVVEFHDGSLDVIETNRNYQLSTNYNLYDGLKRGSGTDRFDKMESAITGNGGMLTEEEALELLKTVAIPGRIQWSSLYNLTTGEMSVFPVGNREYTESFTLEMTHGLAHEE